MQNLIIKNVGPIDFVDIQLNKINLIMGPQSSGKSTIIKIACFCHWVEKRVSMNQSFDFFLQKNKFEESLVEFHKLEGYIRSESHIEYESDLIKFIFRKADNELLFEWKNQCVYRHNKISYIPAERNLVATIPNWLEVKFSDNNIRNFMIDWGNARKSYTKDQSLNIASLGALYYFDSNNDTDYIQTKGNTILKFTNASSGLQSVTPLMVLIKYFTEWIYKNETEKSVRELTLKVPPLQYTNLFIEEPESNLFPSTQRDLLYSMLQAVNSTQDHHLFLTTHSPYILNALNNCMTGFLIKDTISDETKEKLPSHHSWISPEKVSVWQIKDGRLIDIKTSRLNTIGEHYFNETMNEILDEYYVMLKYIKHS